MKTLTLTRYEFGENVKRYCRMLRPKPVEFEPGVWHWNGHANGASVSSTFTVQSIPHRDELLRFCPYGKPGDRIRLARRSGWTEAIATIKAITIERVDEKWCWVVVLR